MWEKLRKVLSKYVRHPSQKDSKTKQVIEPLLSLVGGVNLPSVYRLLIWGALEEAKTFQNNSDNLNQPVTEKELDFVVLTVAFAVFNSCALDSGSFQQNLILLHRHR